jgi:hypothetical protein
MPIIYQITNSKFQKTNSKFQGQKTNIKYPKVDAGYSILDKHAKLQIIDIYFIKCQLTQPIFKHPDPGTPLRCDIEFPASSIEKLPFSTKKALTKGKSFHC